VYILPLSLCHFRCCVNAFGLKHQQFSAAARLQLA
jgi:hypothetical protein